MLRRKRDNQNGMNFTRVYLWRHPEVLGQKDGKFWGHSDVDLSREGKKQAQAMVNYMMERRVQAIYCSDLTRTRKVADSIARTQRSRPKVNPMPELRELSLGLWEGLTYDEIRKRYPEELEKRFQDLPGFKIEGGESLNDLAERVIPAFQKILEDNIEQHICVVGHGGINRVLLCRIMGAPMDYIFRLAQDHACLNVIDVYQDGTPVIKSMNVSVPQVGEMGVTPVERRI